MHLLLHHHRTYTHTLTVAYSRSACSRHLIIACALALYKAISVAPLNKFSIAIAISIENVCIDAFLRRFLALGCLHNHLFLVMLCARLPTQYKLKCVLHIAQPSYAVIRFDNSYVKRQQNDCSTYDHDGRKKRSFCLSYFHRIEYFT